MYSEMKTILGAIEHHGPVILICAGVDPKLDVSAGIDHIVQEVLSELNGKGDSKVIREIVENSLRDDSESILENFKRGPRFQMSKEEWATAQEWIRGREYSRAADGARLIYSFMPSGIGTSVFITDGATNEKKDVTDYGSW